MKPFEIIDDMHDLDHWDKQYDDYHQYRNRLFHRCRPG